MFSEAKNGNALQKWEDPFWDDFPNEEDSENNPEDSETVTGLGLVTMEGLDKGYDWNIDGPEHSVQS